MHPTSVRPRLYRLTVQRTVKTRDPVKPFVCVPRIGVSFIESQALSVNYRVGEFPLPRVRRYTTPIDEKAVGRRLRELRSRRGLTQTEIAEQLRIDQSLVSAYERGTVRLHGAIIAALAKTLRTTSDEILGLKKVQQDGVFSDRRFIRRLERVEKLPKRAKQALLKTIDTYLDGAEKH
jgi:transcriptional regulator with XRE-family HTH domain